MVENDKNEAQKNGISELKITENSNFDSSAEEVSSVVNESGDEAKGGKRRFGISLGNFLLSLVALTIATLMLTYTVCSSIYKKRCAELILGLDVADNTGSVTSKNQSSVATYHIDSLLSDYFYGDIPTQIMTDEALKAYLLATGDRYAAYYTAEEIKELNDEGAGRMQGIGISVINSSVTLNGKNVKALEVIRVYENSPSLEKGVNPGDLIVALGADKVTVDTLGYSDATRKLRGVSGSLAEFTVLRKNGDEYDEISFALERRDIIAPSLDYRLSTLDSKIGIIKISGFELNTPEEFENAVTALSELGCDKFVIDVRNNPGGYLDSIRAVLSFFLNEGDVFIRTEDKNGVFTSMTVSPVEYNKSQNKPCNVTADDIGKYRSLNTVVLCNRQTASAAELFTATFKDYGIGKVIGEMTYGKGKMQTTYMLPNGDAVKFTTHMYYSAISPGYDEIGVSPDIEIPLSEEAAEYNIYKRPDDKDNQLLKAVEYFK